MFYCIKSLNHGNLQYLWVQFPLNDMKNHLDNLCIKERGEIY